LLFFIDFINDFMGIRQGQKPASLLDVLIIGIALYKLIVDLSLIPQKIPKPTWGARTRRNLKIKNVAYSSK